MGYLLRCAVAKSHRVSGLRQGWPALRRAHHICVLRQPVLCVSTVGQKIEWMRTNPLVAVEVFERDGERGWRTVVIDGVFEELTAEPYYDNDRDFAWKLLKKHANWWEPGGIDADGEAPSKSYIYYQDR